MTTTVAEMGRPAVAGREAQARAFAHHFMDAQEWWYLSATKQEPAKSLPTRALADFEFFQPHASICRFFVVDIDSDFWAFHLGDIPHEIQPHAIVETARGAQAFWLIKAVAIGGEARRAPIAYAEAVYEQLREAVGGDKALVALTPAKCRNPLYKGAEVRYSRRVAPYRLGELREGLKKAGLWKSQRGQDKAPAGPAVAYGQLVKGQRNATIFRKCLGAGYRGEDYEALGAQLNELCDVPLSEAELAGIFRSVARYVKRRGQNQKRAAGEPMPEALREFMSELGAKGRAVNSEAQQAQQRAFIAKGTAVRSAKAIVDAERVRALQEQGLSQTAVMKATGFSRAKVVRAWAGP